jgi:hypothetical protein
MYDIEDIPDIPDQSQRIEELTVDCYNQKGDSHLIARPSTKQE